MTRGNIVKVGLVGLLALLLVIVPLIGAGCPAPEVVPATVKVAYLGDITGPYAAVGAPLIKGFTDCAENINAKGGIDGVLIEALWADTRGEAPLSVAAYKRFKELGVVAVSCMVTPVGLAVMDLCEEDKIPGINQTATLSLYIPPRDYFWCHGGVNSNYELAALYGFDTELWDREAWGTWTLGMLAHDNPFTVSGIAAMYKYADTYDVRLLAPEIVPVATDDYTTQIMRLVNGGADVIMVDTVGARTGVVLRQMAELGVLAHSVEEAATVPGKVVAMFGYTSYYAANFVGALDYAPYTYGARGYAGSWQEEYGPGIVEIEEFMLDKYGRILTTVEAGTVYIEGWHNMLVMAAAIERAVEAVGWENLNGETLMLYGLTGLIFDDQGVSGATGYADYPGDRMCLENFALAAWDVEHAECAAITPYYNIRELLPECLTYDYMTVQAGPGWYVPVAP
mgnify:CR=1 FL=1